MAKQCTKCKETKDLVRFGKDKKSKDGYKSSCLDCNRSKLNDNARKWYQSNPEKGLAISHKYKAANPTKHKDSLLQKRYGITLEQRQNMLIKQNNCCFTCNKVENESTTLCVDHCHITGKVRGLLCDSCNRAIGFLKDSIEVSQKITQYLIMNKV